VKTGEKFDIDIPSPWPWPSDPSLQVLGLVTQVLGLGLGIRVLGLDLGLEAQVLVNITAWLYISRLHVD